MILMVRRASGNLRLARIVISFACMMCFGSGIMAQDIDHYPPRATPDRIMLNLTERPTTSVAITWRTAVSVDSGVVQIAEASPTPDLTINARIVDASRTQFVSNLNGANYFSAVVDGLKPGTMYAYRVGYGMHVSEWAHFVTADEEDDELSFIYFGDAQNDIKSLWSRAVRGAFQQMPKADFMLHAGDLVNLPNNDHEWGEWFEAGGWIYQMIPSIATPGNHEYWSDAERNEFLSLHWRPTFTLPKNGPRGEDETTYFIDYKDLRIISINSPGFLAYDQTASAQVSWLERVLKSNKQKWTILTMHHPIYSTAWGRNNDELRDAIQPLLEKYGVDLVLQGHDHSYGRGTNLPIGDSKKVTMDGPIYVVSVSGPKMYPVGLEEWMYRAGSNVQLYQLINIDGDTLRYEAYTVDNVLYDAFELYKAVDGSTQFSDLAPEIDEYLDLPPRFEQKMSAEDKEVYKTRFQLYKERMGKDR